MLTNRGIDLAEWTGCNDYHGITPNKKASVKFLKICQAQEKIIE